MLRTGILTLVVGCCLTTPAGLLAGSADDSSVSGSSAAQDRFSGQNHGFGSLESHDHKPIVVHSRPVVERIPVNVINPVDICVAPDGAMIVADAKANCVFRIHRHGQAELAASDLPDLVRVCVNAGGDLFALTADSSSGLVHQVTSTGFITRLHRVPFVPSGFACDAVGNFLVAGKTNGRLGLLTNQGEYRELTRMAEAAVDVAVNSADQFQVLLSSGRVMYVNAEDHRSTVGFASQTATRLFKLPDGKLATLDAADQNRQAVREVAFTNEAAGTLFAHVPSGTTALAFDKLGNLCLCNPDLRAVTLVTTTFMIRCPHCDQSVRMIFSSEPEPVATDKSPGRSF